MDKLLLMLIGGFFFNGCSSVELTDNDRKYGYMQVNLECGPMTEDKTSVGKASRNSACNELTDGNGSEKGINAIPCSQDTNALIAEVSPSPSLSLSPSCPVFNTKNK
jgi:hypothetical protein